MFSKENTPLSQEVPILGWMISAPSPPAEGPSLSRSSWSHREIRVLRLCWGSEPQIEAVPRAANSCARGTWSHGSAWAL